MKFLSVVFVLLLFTSAVLSQEKIDLKREYQNQTGLTVAGEEYNSPEGSMSWTIGDIDMILVFDDVGKPSDLEDDEFTISTYPNPTIERVYISCNSIENDPYTVTFYDLFGRVALTKMIYDKQNEINVQSLPITMYAVLITDSNGQLLKSFKLLKR